MSMKALTIAVVLCALLTGRNAAAQEAAPPFYAGKQIKIISGFEPGETSDSYARLLARYMPKYIPGNPSMIVQGMLGAGTVRALQYLYRQAPRDGTEIGVAQRAAFLLPIFQTQLVNFDSSKFRFIGSTNKEVLVLYVSNRATQKSIMDLKEKPLILGTTGSGALVSNIAAALENTIGLKFKVVAGYKSAPAINLAIERGEVEGRFLSNSSVELGQWLSRKQGKVLLTLGLHKTPGLEDAAWLFDLLKTDRDRDAFKLIFGTDEMGRPMVAPPGIAGQQLGILRQAFNRSVADPEFQAEARRGSLALNPMTGESMDELMKDLYRIPKDRIEHALEIQKPK
jgi:tripartite-type tricarboxylate transporter receptor subunit TctC